MKNNKENNSVFDLKTMKELELDDIATPTYVIGTSTYDKKIFTYILLRKYENETEFLLLNQRNDETEFKKEVSDLAKYFEATITEKLDNEISHLFIDDFPKKKSFEQMLESFENGKELYQTSAIFNKLVHSIFHGMTYEQAIVECIKVIDQQQETMKSLIEKIPFSVIVTKED